MSEIRKKAVRSIDDVLCEVYLNHLTVAGGEEEILSIPELAIVDREADLPTAYGEGMSSTAKTGYGMAQAEMLKADWIKEVKE